MGLRLHTVEPGQGWGWVLAGLRLFLRKPLAFSGMFAFFMVVFTVLMLVPFIGGLLGMALLPLLTLGFMSAARAARGGGGIGPSNFVDGLREPKARRAMLVLCAGYALMAVATTALASLVAGDSLYRLQQAAAGGSRSLATVQAALADPRLSRGLLVLTLLGSLVSVPFWHAPALVVWGGQGPWQALFSSTLAIWRARGAFALYMFGWVLMSFAAFLLTAVLALVAGLLLGAQAGGTAMLLVLLMFSAAFYVSLWFSFESSFGIDELP